MIKEAMKLALEALETERDNYQDWDKEDGAPEYIYEAITALREALAEQPAQQEPVREMPSNTRYAEGQALTYWDNLPEISAWAERHDINGTPLSLRCMVEDAASLHLTTTPQAQPAQQCKWPICQSEEYQQVLAEQIKRELVGEQPAQQEPCGWQFFQDGKWHNGMEINDHRANTEAAGIPVRDVYPSPPAQPSKPWVRLTPEQRATIAEANNMLVDDDLFDAIEAKLKEKNT